MHFPAEIKISPTLKTTELRRFCEEYLMAVTNRDNFITVYTIADEFNLRKLIDDVSVIFASNFEHIVNSVEFFELEVMTVLKMLSLNDKHDIPEKSIYYAFKQWMDHEPFRRTKYQVEFFNILEFERFTGDFLKVEMQNNPVLENKLKIYESPEDMQRKTKMLDEAEGYKALVVIGGNYTAKEIFLLSVHSFTFTKLMGLPFSHVGGCAAVRDKQIFCMGGWPYDSQCHVIDWKQRSAKRLARMSEERFTAACAADADDQILVFGGWDGVSTVKTAETFTSEVNEWRTSGSSGIFKQPRSGHAVCKIGKGVHAELFCFGGQNNEGEVLGSLEVRHFGTGSTYGAPMKERRYGLVGVAIGNHIYAVGGFNGTEALSSVERYDHDTGEWSYVRSMTFERFHHAGGVINGNLYIVGGCGTNDSPVTVEMYRPEVDSWNVVMRLPQLMYHHSVVVWCIDKEEEDEIANIMF